MRHPCGTWALHGCLMVRKWGGGQRPRQLDTPIKVQYGRLGLFLPLSGHDPGKGGLGTRGKGVLGGGYLGQGKELGRERR